LATVVYAHRALTVARLTQREGSETQAEMRAFELAAAEQRRLAAQASQLAHDQEIRARREALEAEIGLQRLMQLARVSDLLVCIGEMAAREMVARPTRMGSGVSIRTTSIPIARDSLRVALTMLSHLGGPELLKAKELAKMRDQDFGKTIELARDALDEIADTASEIRPTYPDGDTPGDADAGLTARSARVGASERALPSDD
jgi:hypothetical protein